MDAVISRTAAVLLGLMLVYAGSKKLDSRARFRDSIRTWQVVPQRLIGPASWMIAESEILLGAFAVFAGLGGTFVVPALACVATLLALFFVGHFVIIRSTSGADCGCFGLPSRLTWRSALRPGVLSSLSVVFAVWAS